MSKTPEEMNDDELEAAQRVVDGEDSDTSETSETTEDEESTDTTTEGNATEQQEQTTDETTDGTAEAADTTTESTDTTAEAQTSAVAEEPAKVSGVASKDGTRVLPYSALQAERRSHRQAAARADRFEKELQQAKQDLDDLRAGKSKDSGELTEAEVQRMEDEFPEAGAKMRAVFTRNQELAKQVAAAKPKEAPVEDVTDDPAQEAIDQVPMLVEWQHDPAHADKWNRSIELDNALINSPKWKGKDPAERFAHVAKLVAEEFDIEVPSAKAPAKDKPSSTTPAKPKPDPKKVIEQAETTPPNTLSDMKGGSVPDHGQVDFKNMTPQAMVGKFMSMSDDEIDRQLAKLG